MQALLKNKTIRKHFLIIVGLILVVILTIRLFVIPSYYTEAIPDDTKIKIVSDIFDKIFTSLLVSVFIGLFLFYIEIPEAETNHKIIEASLIREIFARARLRTDFWYFSGGAGRYTRAVTIPELAKITKNTNAHRSMKIIILDPSNNELCRSYASYRNGLRSSNNEWNANFVKTEILATICVCVIYYSNYLMFDIEIYLKNSFSTMRIDLNIENAVITKEDKTEPAILIPADTFLFRTYKQEILQSLKQCEKLELVERLSIISMPVQVKSIELIISHLGLGTRIASIDFEKIAEIININENPYK